MPCTLFTPLTLRSVTLRNRIGVSPMCLYACASDGLATPWHMVHLGARAAGGFGLVVAEATAVSPRARISANDLGLWSAAHADALAPITRLVSDQGAVPGIQLGHAGRKGSTQAPWIGRKATMPHEGGWEVLAPSAIPFGPDSAEPREMDESDIEATLQEFAHAANLALRAGFRYVELHLAHGYLAHQFLSPLTNRRQDRWGGHFEGRSRFARELVRHVRSAWPRELPLAVRLSMTDWIEGGWTEDEAVRLAGLLRDAGVDLIVCSSGGIAPGSAPRQTPGMHVPAATRVRSAAGVASAAVGLITEPEQAQAIVSEGRADMVFLARATLRDPNWALHAAEALGEEAPWPICYRRAVARRPRIG